MHTCNGRHARNSHIIKNPLVAFPSYHNLYLLFRPLEKEEVQAEICHSFIHIFFFLVVDFVNAVVDFVVAFVS